MTESLIGTGAFFHEAVKPTIIIEPIKAAFYLPPLTAISGVFAFKGGDRGLVVVPPDDAGHYVTFL